MAGAWPWETELVPQVGPLLLGEASGHDLAHCLRVRNLAQRIAQAEGGDRQALVAAAYLHDLFRGDPANADKARAVAFAEDILPRVGFPTAGWPAVRACIRYHSWSARHQPEPGELPPEVFIFRDADRLDALGAWGVVRTFAYGGEKNRPSGFDALTGDWAALDPAQPTSGLHSSPVSSIGHFHEKLLRLRDHMHTPTGRALAEERHACLVAFLARLDAEMAAD